MYRSFEISGFRCFDHLKIDGLQRVNLIAGMNNAGKTSLLEAIFLHGGAYNPELTLSVNAFRGLETLKLELGPAVVMPWESLFGQFDASRTVELVGDSDTTGRRSIRLRVLRTQSELAEATQPIENGTDAKLGTNGPSGIVKGVSTMPVSATVAIRGLHSTSDVAQVLMLECEEGSQTSRHFTIVDRGGLRTHPIPPRPPFITFFQAASMHAPLADVASRFGALELDGKQDVVSRALQIVEPRLKRLAIVMLAGEPVLHGDIGIGRLVALPVMGEGMVRLASLILCIGNAPNGAVLVDEIENGLHWTVLTKVWSAIADAARQFNTQIFATTHSHECIVAAHHAFSESGSYDFRLHRLDRTSRATRVVTYDEGMLDAAIETNLEVR
jgi:hypothetical protein